MTPLKSTSDGSRSRRATVACAVAAAVWILGVAATTTQVLAQDHDHEAGANGQAEAARMVNPVKATPASITKGKSLFSSQCQSCHGATGLGDGKSAAQLTPKPSNLTDETWTHGSSDGDIYTLIKNGAKNTGMRGFASKMTEEDMWNVVNYIRTLKADK